MDRPSRLVARSMPMKRLAPARLGSPNCNSTTIPSSALVHSNVRLDKFVYDPNNKGAGKVAINATKGAYRFITGEQDKKAYEITTPYATLGVRGTVLEIVVVPSKGKRKAGRA